MLTDRPPFRGPGRDAVPGRPDDLRRPLGCCDLETIRLKCLEKSPDGDPSVAAPTLGLALTLAVAAG